MGFVRISSYSALFLFHYCGLLSPMVGYFMLKDRTLFLEGSLCEIGSVSVTVPVLLDSVSLSFSFVVCLISACVCLFTSSYMAEEVCLKRFVCLVLLFVLSMNLLVFIPSLITLLIGWDGLGIVSFALVIYYQNVKSLNAGMLTLLVNRVGDVSLLLGLGLLVDSGQWLLYPCWGTSTSMFVAFFICVAAMTKSAQVPFSSWLPAAMAAPTPVSALVHSSTLVTAGVYLLVRFYPMLATSHFFHISFFFISVLTMLMAGSSAVVETDMKKVIALSTLSQLGVMMLGLAMGSVWLTLYHLYTHALFKALLFLCAGNLIHCASGSQDLRTMGALVQQLPLTAVCLNVANLSLCGAPFLSGFYSKDLLLEWSLSSTLNGFLVILLLVATGLTMAYSVRLSFATLWSSPKSGVYHTKGEDWHTLTAMSILAFCAVVAGSGLQVLCLSFNPPIFLGPAQKLVVPICLGLGFLWAICFWYFSNLSPGFEQDFLSKMWYLTPLSTTPAQAGTMLVSGHIVKSIEGGWAEVFGGGGSWILSTWLTQQNSRLQGGVISSFVLLMALPLFLFW